MFSRTLAQLLSVAAQRFGDKVALITGERSYTFRDLNRAASQLANALESRGISAGDRVSIYAPNSAEWIITYHATLRLGACVNPVNVMLTPAEIRHVLQDCGSSALFSSRDKLELLKSDCALSALKVVVGMDGAPFSGVTTFEELCAAGSAIHHSADVELKSLSTICYTSGTTGRPKGAMLSHEAVLMNAQLTALMHGRTSGDVVVTALPLPHVYGNVIMNAALLTGMTLVLHTRFQEQAILDSIAEHHATMFEGVPTMYHLLLNHPGLAEADLSPLRICTVGGQTMAVSKMLQVQERFGCPLVELWGMTEIAGLGTTFSHFGPIRHGSIGIPLPYVEVRIDDPANAGCELPPGQAGELMIRGPIVMQGYFNNEAETREVLEPDGWLHTGDIARKDGDGCIYVVDRKKDMILTAGFNVYPAEIERVLSEHPAVALCAVGGVPDEIKGELPKAYVVPKIGTTPEADELILFCRERLAAYKVPRAIQFVTDLPKTSSGKIMRRALRSLDL